MAYYSIFPEKDSTIYSHPDRTRLNTGKDEVLELLEEKDSSKEIYYPSRFLIKFKNTEIKEVLETKLKGISTWATHLEVFATEHKSLHSQKIVQVYAISQSWDEGTGRFKNNPTSSNGVNWEMRTDTGSSARSKWTTSSFGTGTTGSIDSSLLQKGGGTWYTGSAFQSTQQFLNDDPLDINLDVTTIVQKWSSSLFAGQTYPTGITNNGFILRHPNSVETNTSSSFGEMQYFSSDTDTVYPPSLTFRWDDSSFDDNVTGSMASLTMSGELENHIFIKGLQPKYRESEKVRFRIGCRKKYVQKTFTESVLTSSFYIPEGSSSYSVIDVGTNTSVVPFSAYTSMSCDSTSMYFDQWLNTFEPGRYYKVLFKLKYDDGQEVIIDNDEEFKVI